MLQIVQPPRAQPPLGVTLQESIARHGSKRRTNAFIEQLTPAIEY
jgi:hypothetical protein